MPRFSFFALCVIWRDKSVSKLMEGPTSYSNYYMHAMFFYILKYWNNADYSRLQLKKIISHAHVVKMNCKSFELYLTYPKNIYDHINRTMYLSGRRKLIFWRQGTRVIQLREIKLDVTSSGKRQKWNFCGRSLALWTVEWKYLYLWRIVGDIFLFLCDLIKDYKKRTQTQRSSLPFAVCRIRHA